MNRDFRYAPVLSLRPAEIWALEETSDKAKDLMLPTVLLKPWMKSSEFSAAPRRVEQAFGCERPWIASLDGRYTPPDPDPDRPRQALADFARLRESADGYAAWCDFVAGRENIIPCLQLEDRREFARQLSRLAELDRPVALHIGRNTELTAAELQALADCRPRLPRLYLIFDYETIEQSSDPHHLANQKAGLVRQCSERLPGCRIIISATSFPTDFQGREGTVPIQERLLYSAARQVWAGSENLIYGDRGSARIEERGRSLHVVPRVDYADGDSWHFFRSHGGMNSDDWTAAYRANAARAMRDDNWDPELRIWGTQMIEDTVAGSDDGIDNYKKNDSARINIHMHQQIFHGNRQEMIDATVDEWQD